MVLSGADLTRGIVLFCVNLVVPCWSECAGCHKTRVHPVATREDIAGLLQLNRFKTGAELGVQRGHFARHNLLNWESCEEYILVDAWKAQENYVDLANKGAHLLSPAALPPHTTTAEGLYRDTKCTL